MPFFREQPKPRAEPQSATSKISSIAAPVTPARPPSIEMIGIGRIGRALAYALHEQSGIGNRVLLQGTVDDGRRNPRDPVSDPAARYKSHPTLVVALVVLREQGAPPEAEQTILAARAAGARVLAILTHPVFPDQGFIPDSLRSIRFQADMTVVVPEYPDISLLRCLLNVYRTAIGDSSSEDGRLDIPIGCDYLDVRYTFDRTRGATIGVGIATGPGRIRRAAFQAIRAVGQLELFAAAGTLVVVAGAASLEMIELVHAMRAVQAVTSGAARPTLAPHIDERMGDVVRVTIVTARSKRPIHLI